MNLKISEIFLGIQGEGCNVGIPMVFVRLYGCSMRCQFCDTTYSWEDKDVQRFNHVEVLTEEQILEKVKSFGCQRVCLTGGEPLEQNINTLCEMLVQAGYKIALETNGSIYSSVVYSMADWIAVAPKHRGIDGQWLCRANEFKFVIRNTMDLRYAEKVKTAGAIVKWIQPCDADPSCISLCAQYILDNPHTTLRLGYQLHKLYNLK
jgi:7-carboxy-7-deazaguanine synthase